MRQGDGSELLGPGDPRNPDIGILHVESKDSRQEILTAISTQELQGRKQIAIVLPEQGKAFRQPVDFDGLKNMRRQLKAQLIFIAPSGPGPAEFARQRRFPVYSSLENFKSALLNEGIPTGNQRVKTNPGGGKKPGLPGFGSGKPPAPSPRVPVQLPISPIPPGPSAQPQQIPPASPSPQRRPAPFEPRPSGGAPPPMPIDEIPTIEINQPDASDLPGTAPAGLTLGEDDELYETPTHAPVPAPPSPIAQGSATPSGPAVGPARSGEPPSRPPQESRAVRDIIVFPSATPATTPKTTGNMPAVPSQAGRRSVPLPASPANAGAPTPQATPPAASPQNPPAGRNGAAGSMAPVAPAAAAVLVGAGSPPTPGTATAAGSGRPAAGQRPAGLTPLPSPYSRRSRRRLWRRTVLLLLLLLLLSGALAIGILAANRTFTNLTARVTITPQSKLETDNYLLAALPTGTPDPARRQIGARLLTQTSGSSTATGHATGDIPATRASGTLTFQNVGGSNAQVTPGVLTGGDGVEIAFYQSVTVPPASNPTLIGYAVTPGAAGNITALDLDGRCCAPNVFVKNLAPFTGGHDAVPHGLITQGDINAAAQPLVTSLTQSTESALQAQVASSEHVVDQSFACTPTVHPSVPANTPAPTVTVSVQVTCHQEVYDFAAAQTMTTKLLSRKAQSDPALTSPYMQQGQTLSSVLSDTVVTREGQVSLEIQVQGLWVYQFGEQMQQRLKQTLVSLPKEQALTRLQRTGGVAAATISLSSGTMMPANASNITLSIQTLPGVQASPSGTAGSRPTVPATGLTPTPTAKTGLGGS